MADFVKGTVRYSCPDLSIPPEDRGLFSFPPTKSTEDAEVDLINPATATDLVQGPEGLDAQGFAYLKHQFSLSTDQLMRGTNFEDFYIPEVEALIRKITGAKRTVVNQVAIRKKLSVEGADPTFYHKAGDEQDQVLKGLAKKESAFVSGREDAGVEPARYAHCDFTLRGLKRTARYCRKDIKAAAQEALDAEDNNEEPRRYASYSVWRPLKPVKRDPLAVADCRTVDTNTLQAAEYRATSNVNDSGEYMLESYTQTSAANSTAQKWYCMPNQTPEDVLIIKFADTASERDPSIAPGCPHCSATVPGTEDEEPRMSVEARVLAFW